MTKKNRIRRKVYHILSIAFIIAALYFSAFRFQTVFFRMLAAVKDLALSLGYCSINWIEPFEGLIKPTVTEIPRNAIAILPLTWEEVELAIEKTWERMFTRINFFTYLAKWLEIFGIIVAAIIPIIILAAVGLLIGYFVYVPRKKRKKKKNNAEADEAGNARTGKKKTEKRKKGRPSVDTKQLKAFYKFEDAAINPIVNFIRGYDRQFLRRWKWYRIALVLIWLYNLNVFTVILETFAYIFYLGGGSNDFFSIYSQIAKLAIDLYIPLKFLPLWAEVIIGFKSFHAIRCFIADGRLKKYINKLMEWLKKVPGTIFFHGRQRAGKTTLAVVFGLLESARFRIMSAEAMKRRRKQFPYFPWRNVEKTIRRARARHVIYNLPTAFDFAVEIRSLFEGRGKRWHESKPVKKLEYLKRKYGYCGDNLLFGYKYDRFPMKYDDGIRTVSIFDALEAYVRLYFIYSNPTPIIYSSFSTRTDEIKKTRGHLEKYDLNFTKRKTKDMKKSQYSHVLPWDGVRLGTLMDPLNPYKDAVEFGVIIATEYEKEVGNQNTTGGEKRDAKECNRKNDGHSDWIKTVTHMATVDGDTYIRWICDGHRTGGMAAEFNDLCTNAHVKKKSDSKIVLPCFAFEELLWLGLSKIYDWLEGKLSYYRGDNTLLMYLVNKIFKPFDLYCERIKKRYSVYTTTIDWKDGTNGESIKANAKHVIPEILAYSDRFATDTIGSFFYEKSRRSKKGINDVPLFETKTMTFNEMIESGSHFYKRLGEQLYLAEFIRAQKERDEWLKQREKEEKEGARTKREK